MSKQMLDGVQVVLRPPTLEDQKQFLELNRESHAFHRRYAATPMNVQKFEDFVDRCGRSDAACFFICRKRDGQILGSINLSQIVLGGFRSAYLGYFIGAKYANQGFMTEALQLMLRYAFRKLKLHRVEANIQPDNGPSLALVRRAGFVREGFSRKYLKIDGRWRDHERWTLLAEDWTSRPNGAVRSRTNRSRARTK